MPRTRRPLATWLFAAALGAWVIGPRAALPTVAAPPVAQAAQVAAGIAPEGDEFVGPFASWIDVRRDHGAVGDGIADDTDALQAALTAVRKDAGPKVVYVPRGAYRVTRTLDLVEALGVSLLGEHPDRTTIVWDGAQDGTILNVAGIAYSRVGRITFDGRRRAMVAVEQSWDNARGPFDTGNEYADDRFVDVQFGIHGGFKGYGFAETSVVRGRFIRNTRAGVALGNFNALDIWVWDSWFEDCGIGVTNDPGAGNFRVYQSVFRRSTVADLSMQNTGGFTARDNLSMGSRAFWLSGAPLNHPATIDIQRNTILDPESPVAIRLANQGPGLLMDNRVRSLPGVAGPVVSWTSLFGADVVSLGNSFTVANAVSANGRLVMLDDRLVSRASISTPEPAPAPALPNSQQPVVEVPANAPGSVIQQAIDEAVRRGASRPVVHLPTGAYAIDRTLVLPAAGVQVVGDGMHTVLRWEGQGRGPVLSAPVGARAAVRELVIDGAGRADGVVAQVQDSDDTRVYLGGVQLRSGEESNLFVDGLDHANVDLVDFGHAYAPRGVSVRITGGGAPVHTGRTIIYSGASSGNRLSYEVAGGATLVARDIWYEGPAEGGFARVHGAGAFTMQGSRVATPAGWTPPAFAIDGFTGRFSLLTTLFDDRVVVTGASGGAEVLALANLRERQDLPHFTNSSSGPSRVVVRNMRQRTTGGIIARGTVAVPDAGTFEASTVRRLLQDTRSIPARPPSVSAGSGAHLSLHRVWVQRGLTNVHLKGGP